MAKTSFLSLCPHMVLFLWGGFLNSYSSPVLAPPLSVRLTYGPPSAQGPLGNAAWSRQNCVTSTWKSAEYTHYSLFHLRPYQLFHQWYSNFCHEKKNEKMLLSNTPIFATSSSCVLAQWIAPGRFSEAYCVYVRHGWWNPPESRLCQLHQKCVCMTDFPAQTSTNYRW